MRIENGRTRRIGDRLALVAIAAVVGGAVLLFGCGNEITTKPAPEEGYFPLRIRNTWTYDIDDAGLVSSETWTVIDDPPMRLGGDLVQGFVLERAGAFGTTWETLVVREGAVLSLGISGSGTVPTGGQAALWRYPKDGVPASASGLPGAAAQAGMVGGADGVEAPLAIRAVETVSVGSADLKQQTARYEDCLAIEGSIPGVLSSSETVCRGVGVVRGSRVDVAGGKTRTWTLVFFELRT